MIKKEIVQKNFNRAACHYDAYAHIQKTSSLILASLLQKAFGKKTPRMILDIGCGSGQTTEALAHYFPNTDFILNDIAENMLTISKKKYAHKTHWQFWKADAEHASLPHHNIDTVVSNLSMQWFSNLHDGLKHWWQQTDTLAFSIPTRDTFASWSQAYKQLQLSAPTHIYPDRQTLEAWCKNLQPAQQLITFENHDLHFDSALDFVKHLKHTGAHTPASNTQPTDLRKILRQFPSGITVNYAIFYAVLRKNTV